jgi:immune inhibitor A
VQHELDQTAQMTVALIDFSDVKHGGIAQPDRSKDNTTYWAPDFSPQHYKDMLFSSGGASYGHPSMHDFYLQLSSGKMTWDGQVSNWTPIQGTAADYGANKDAAGGDDANGSVTRVVKAALAGLAANNYSGLDTSKMDVEDRYDCDGDGNFNEPDGYIDHFAIVHAGLGEEAGADPNTIWSHRSYANFNDAEGPGASASQPDGCHLGGYKLPGTDLWAGDYTIEPENGGMGVFAHEFGHDLGLPDMYDTSYGSENGTGFWSLMSSGSWGSYAQDPYIGTSPVQMGAWEKLALGWLDVQHVAAGDSGTFDLGPGEGDTSGNSQALAIDLPDYTRTENVFPVDGADANYLYSMKGDNLDNSAVKQLGAPLSADTPIAFRADYAIEQDWDYAYVDALVDGTWQHVKTNVSTETSPHEQNFGEGITGTSNGWTDVTGTLPAGTTAYRFRYWTDGATQGLGFAADSVKIGSGAADGMTDVSGWDLSGFRQLANGAYTSKYGHYYLAESRSYVHGDESLCGAYNFIDTAFTLVEKRCYARGLLVWVRDKGYANNNTSDHPGAGEILPVDAHPDVMRMPDGKSEWRGRWQTWDSPFALDPQSVQLSQLQRNGQLRSRTYDADPVTVFDDSSPTAYWNRKLPYNSVKTAGSGVRLSILGATQDRSTYRVRVSSGK